MRFSVRFLGCKVSQADALVIRDALRRAGHAEAPPEDAEVHVVNTCALTREAEKKSRKQAHRSARSGRTFVTGCAVNLNREQFSGEELQTIPGSVDRVAEEIVDALGGIRTGACADDSVAAIAGRTRAFLKVQNGCDATCAFCIIPTTRGSAESRPMSRVLEDGRRRLSEGHPELVLTGINIGTYRDPQSGYGLAGLVRATAGLPGLLRVRISSIEPGSVDDELLATMAETPRVAPHLHIPLQSGDAQVLARMRRGYTPGDYLDACARARRAVPGLNITTDVIVGFPGETDDAFANTVAVVEEAGISRVHVFPFSPRPGTDAARLPDEVDGQTRRERAAELRALSERRAFDHRNDRLGTDDVVLIERRHDDGSRSGLGADYVRFTLPPGHEGPGEAVAVRAEGHAGEHLHGEPVA